MRIAACFSGKTRNFEDTFPYFKKNLFDKFNTDIFIFSSPNRQGFDNNSKRLKELYSPKKIILNDNLFYKNISEKYIFKDPVAEMWCNIFNSDKLRREYEFEKNIKYDYVFRMRFDFFFLRTLDDILINLKDLTDNSIAIPYRWNFSEIHPMSKTDMFSIGTSESMTKYCNLFNHIDDYIPIVPKNNNGTPHPESLLGVYLNSIGMTVIPTESPYEFEYPDEINIGSNDLAFRSNYRKYAFD
jgi:hypothetical protein